MSEDKELLIAFCNFFFFKTIFLIFRLEAIKCIAILSSIWDKNIDSEIRIQIVQLLIKFIPGVLSVCSVIVDATDTQHHSITVVRY